MSVYAINAGFGFHVGAYKGDPTKQANFLNRIKVAMYIPVINLVAIGIMASIAKGNLFRTEEGKIFLMRCVVSVIAAPILLPIDLVATVAIHVILNRMKRRAVL